MKKLSALALAAACSATLAQTPATNPMPDGSHDMYVGLGAVSAPRYEGAERRKVSALPVLQVQWSNGFFISGMTAGIHLSQQPSYEFGPLLALQARRDETGNGKRAGEVGALIGQPGFTVRVAEPPSNRMEGMEPIATRLLAGGFFNYYVAPQWRLTSSVLYGAGNERNGALLDLGVQRLAAQMGERHRLSVAAGITVANRNYNQAYFGVSEADALRSGNGEYAASGGLKDAYLSARWNWALSPGWMLTSQLQATRLLGSAKTSPLVERPTNLTVSTAIAYRF